MKKNVFISHVSDDTEIAQWLKTRLDRDFLGTLDIFVSSDRSTIEAGRRWLDEVEKALRDADLQIVLSSRASIGRPWVNFEAGAVWLRGIPVVPVCHSGLQPEDLPIPLKMLESVAFGQPAGLAKLYDIVARTAGLSTPPVDFDALAVDAREFEARYAQTAGSIEVVESPHVLCAASRQYAEPSFGFHLDEAVVQEHFPGRVMIERSLTHERLLNLLATQRFDIVHLVLCVDRATGGLIFDPVDEATREPPPGAEVMSPDSFAELLVEARTRLVVLATCEALLLAVDVARIANMAATDQVITGQEAAAWEKVFYGLLAQGKSVHKAFDITRRMKTPIRVIRQKDVIFRVPPAA